MKRLLKAGIRKQLQSIMAIIILFTIMTVSIVVAISIDDNSKDYISSEMDRLGFGDETIWVSTKGKDMNYEEEFLNLKMEIEVLEEVNNVSLQKLIFSGYSIGDMRSDDEGQMILYEPEKYSYRFFNDSVTGYQTISNIQEGDIYISPTMASNFDAKIGDVITFRLSRNGVVQSFRIAGYFEDPFMGSSMIDMKSFLIGEKDYENVINLINETDTFNVLGRSGAMLHIFQNEESNVSVSTLNSSIQSYTNVGNYLEFTYSKEAISGFMIILQNIVVAFLITFAIILGIICVLILGHSISNSIEQDYIDMAILKSVGATSKLIRTVQMLQYVVGEVCGILIGIVISYLLSQVIEQQMIYSTGLLIPGRISLMKSVIVLILLILLFALFIYYKTKKIVKITPVSAMKGRLKEDTKKNINSKVNGRYLLCSYAFRQIISSKKRYIGIITVAFLLTSLVITVNKMNVWLGPNGEGLMNSFSVAQHDIGVQPNHDMDTTEIENIIKKYADISYTYELAMQNGIVEEVDYTINVIDNPELFHILRGRSPSLDSEIVVTEYVASDLGVSIGDVVTVGGSTGSEQYSIVGIYTCANEMGANIGMTRYGFSRIGNVNDFIWCKHYILSDSSYNELIMQELQNVYPMDIDIHTNSWSGLNGIITMMKLLTTVMYIIVFIVIIVIVMLTSSKLLQREQHDLAILKSLGATSIDLRIIFMIRMCILSFIGTIIGCILSGIFADSIISILLSKFGISDFNAGFNIIGNVVMPLIIIILFTVTAYLYSAKIKKFDIMELIHEI